jgi:hypothetical protein
MCFFVAVQLPINPARTNLKKTRKEKESNQHNARPPPTKAGLAPPVSDRNANCYDILTRYALAIRGIHEAESITKSVPILDASIKIALMPTQT